jgi:branched-chain amino acid transport system substrate-binding protein
VTLARRPAVAVLVPLCAVLLAGCLSDESKPTGDKAIHGHLLTLYSSLPSQGPTAELADAVGAGERQALADSRGRAGPYRVRLVRLSSSKPGTLAWDPGQVTENATRAGKDPRAIAYLGELDLGASAVSVPVTNKVGLLQVSPGDGLTSLTQRPPGRAAAGPERYYPTAPRTFLPLVPKDLAQANLIVARMRSLGLDRPALVVGTGVYARELAGDIAARARAAGIAPVASEDLDDDDPKSPLDVSRKLVDSDPDAVVLALARAPTTPALVAALGRSLPRARLLTGSGVLVGEPLALPDGAATPFPLEAMAPEAPRGATARRTLRRIVRGQHLSSARPEALWGYEAVRVVLDAIRATERRGGLARRAEVVREALAPRVVRRSPIGTYEIRPDRSIRGLPMAVYRLVGDRFEPASEPR